MRLHDQMAETGARLFRWRSYVLLIFVPFLILATTAGPRIEQALGPIAGYLYCALCILLVIGGELVRIFTVAFVDPNTSGRNVKEQVASELNTTGIYSLLRNPLYFGNCLMYLGVVLYGQSLVLGLILVLTLIPYYERIIAAEETFLAARFGQPYEDWCRTTPAFLPRLYGWTAPTRRFSPRMLISREYTSVFGAIVSLYLVNLGLALLGPGGGDVADIWHWVLGLSAGAALCVYLIKTRTLWLKADRAQTGSD
jgi:protein-S-isoprenylcysteine O-methyltransferase Ste14